MIAASGAGAVAADCCRPVEEGEAVEQAGQGVARRHLHQFQLHLIEAFGGAQTRIKLVGRKGQLQDVVGAAIERLDDRPRGHRPPHQADIDRALEAREQARVPAGLDRPFGIAGVEHDEGVGGPVGFKLFQRALRLGKVKHVMAPRFKDRADRFPGFSQGRQEHYAHSIFSSMDVERAHGDSADDGRRALLQPRVEI